MSQGVTILEPIDKFGNKILPKTYGKLQIIRKELVDNGWRESSKKANLFYKKCVYYHIAKLEKVTKVLLHLFLILVLRFCYYSGVLNYESSKHIFHLQAVSQI